MDDVLTANLAFYDAHEARDLDAIRAVWDHGAHSVCIHPGWPILRGWPVIEDSWRRIFDGPGRNQFIVTNEVVATAGDMAWITLDENLVAQFATGTVAATNAFLRTATGGSSSSTTARRCVTRDRASDIAVGSCLPDRCRSTRRRDAPTGLRCWP